MNGRMRAILCVGFVVQTAACGPTSTPDANAEAAGAQSTATQIDWKAVDAAMGRSGTMMPGGVYRFNMPRSDLTVTSRGVRIRPALSLGSWLAFKVRDGGNEVVAMGDLVLTEEEYNRVISRLQQGGVGQTAVHKHLPEHSPGLWWTHIHGHGDPVRIAQTVRAALALTGTPAQSPPAGAAATIELDTAGIRQALGHGGQVNGGVYQVSVPRAETIRAMGIEVPPSMGMANVMNFQPTGEGRAAINGDFVMTAGEVDPVIRALREHGIEIVELHHHLTDEEPRLFFMHFWANDDAVKLARGLRAALDRTNSARGAGAASGTGASPNAGATSWNFDSDAAGALPAGWKVEQTNPRGQGAQWAVRQDASAPSGSYALSLTNPRGATGGTYNLAWTDRARFQNGRIEVKVKAGTGREDQGGGPIWRVQDRNNYYIARWNPLEDNFRLYYVKDGRRQQLESANVDLPAGQWHTIAIDHQGNRIVGYLNGKRAFETTDDTFSQPGGVGVWTKADAATFFDDLMVTGGGAQ